MHVKLYHSHMTPIVKRLIGLRKETNNGNSSGGNPNGGTSSGAAANCDDKWHEKAVKGLARRLKKNLDALEDLEKAIISQDPHSPCVTIPRSLDGRLQVSQRKCLPHIVYCQIWRWPDITSHQQIKGIESCSYAYNLKSKYVCVNPYHYERASGASQIPPVIVTRRTPADISERLSEIYSRFNGYMSPSEVVDAYTSVHSAFASPTMSNPTPPGYMSEDGVGTDDSQMVISPPTPSRTGQSHHTVHPFQQQQIINSHASLQDSLQNIQGLCSPSSSGTTPSSGISGDFNIGSVGPSIGSLAAGLAGLASFGSPTGSFTSNYYPLSCASDSSSNFATGNSAFASSSTAVAAAHQLLVKSQSSQSHQLSLQQQHQREDRKDDSNANITNIAIDDDLTQVTLIAYPELEYWCSIIYYELSVRLGDKYNASEPCLIVDGYTDPASPGRFCLGRISNVNRQPVTEHIRQHIGSGIKIYHNGTEVTLECLSSSSVFVQSALSNERYNWEPSTVCKVPPGGSLVLFNYKDFSQMLNKSVFQGYETVFSLIRKCSIRLSFVKGWGADYRRRDILSTPCWIEVQLNGPLRWLDQVLSQIGPPLAPCSSMS